LTFRKRNPDLSTFQPFWPLWLSDILNIWPFDHLTLRFMTLNFWHSEEISYLWHSNHLTIWPWNILTLGHSAWPMDI
jgi:hypothetical protein